MNPVHKADHLYNFCVTSNALRDWYLNDKSIADKNERRQYFKYWSRDPAIKAATEIGNNSKHFSFKATKTKSVEFGARELLFTSVNKYGVPQRRLVDDFPDMIITLSSGEERGLFEFTREVVNYWKEYYLSEGYVIEEQNIDLLIGLEA
jgi:hypothetical protein